MKLSRTDGKPASFLVGAPFSWDQGQGVPNVDGFIDVIRDRVSRSGPQFLDALDKALASAGGPERYQTAMAFVYDQLDADAAADVVRTAVLRARTPTAPALDPATDFDGLPDDWHISRAQRGLAQLMKLSPERFAGPIFTTNFDPLIALALRERGFRPRPTGIPLDGSINAPVQTTQDEINVFHLHGYWRGSPTLHRPQQLIATRPHLRNSLEHRLNNTHLVVMAYSGWDDIFTTAIANCLASDTFKGTVTWCFYGDTPAVIRDENEALFEKFKSGIQQGRISFFCGINCHTFFDDLIGYLGLTPNERAAIDQSPHAGWNLVTTEFLAAQTPLSGDEAVRYFDGAVPTWRHATSPLIPRLSHAQKLLDRIASPSVGASRMQLIRAAGGEGKSTALLQAAVDALDGGDCTVLHRSSVDAGLNPDVVASLDPDRNWLLVADDAEGLVDDLWGAAVKLHETGRQNVFLLLAARDTDWASVNCDRHAWSTRLHRLDDIVLGGVEEPDAALVVDAWAEQGDAGLRGLMSSKSREERIARLVAATKAQDVRGGDGSFFGGLLDTRFSSKALVDHLVLLMDPLRHQPVEGGSGTLYDALLYTANCHAVGMPGLDRRLLALLCDLNAHSVSSAVISRLGRELGAAESRGHVLTRHKRVAQSVVEAGASKFGTDLSKTWRNLVTATVELSRKERVGESFGSMVHAGARLKRQLPEALVEDLRGEIGIAAAEAAVEAMPEWSSTVVDFARALRFARYPDEACDLLKKRLPTLKGTVDLRQNIRGYFYEGGTCAGNLGTRQGYIANAWLAAYSLSESLPPEVTVENAKVSCAGLGVAFEFLVGGVADGNFAKSRRAATELGWQTKPDPRTAGYFERHESELDAIGTPKPADNDEALVWLATAAHAAWQELEDPFLKNKLKSDGQFTFTKLRKLLDRG
ncbi:SIR2 family protein [Roseicyclus sp. F158]|uniref:SIR2 family protein n=1 Tax=Tropicimonas omnivorans TaxID=3075590 RepID=A0ABU3DLB6_9RHOB|nr:SIR2 family protein [Roseicyclus sp. F158]MDT0684506.1 SIR2 family protein [Roseicyclus sp. F158]